MLCAERGLGQDGCNSECWKRQVEGEDGPVVREVAGRADETRKAGWRVWDCEI